MEKETEEFDFDLLTTTDSVRILKPLLPYLPESMQKHLAIFIKMKELIYLSSSFSEIQKQYSPRTFTDFDFSSFKKYCSKEQLEIVNQLESMKSALELYSQYTEMMGQMSPPVPETSAPEVSASDDSVNEGNDTMSATIMNFLTEEQRAMYEKFKNL